MNSKYNILAEVVDNKSKKLLEKESRILKRNKIKEESDNKNKYYIGDDKIDIGNGKTMNKFLFLSAFLKADLRNKKTET